MGAMATILPRDTSPSIDAPLADDYIKQVISKAMVEPGGRRGLCVSMVEPMRLAVARHLAMGNTEAGRRRLAGWVLKAEAALGALQGDEDAWDRVAFLGILGDVRALAEGAEADLKDKEMAAHIVTEGTAARCGSDG